MIATPSSGLVARRRRGTLGTTFYRLASIADTNRFHRATGSDWASSCTFNRHHARHGLAIVEQCSSDHYPRETEKTAFDVKRDRPASILGCYRHAQPVEGGVKRYLARKPGRGLVIGRAFDQIVFVAGRGRKLIEEFGVDDNMAGRAGAAAPAKRHQFVDAGIADVFHYTDAGFGGNRAAFTITRDNMYLVQRIIPIDEASLARLLTTIRARWWSSCDQAGSGARAPASILIVVALI